MISVIIPVYNGEKYISDIFRCFQSQSYKDFELLFINDGSTDGTLCELEKHISMVDISVKVINQENKGVSAARNRGINEAKGEYLCFCDVDDLIHENFLFMLYQSLLMNVKCDIVICETKSIKKDDKLFVSNLSSLKSNISFYDSNEILSMYLYGSFKTGVWGALYRSRLIKENKLLFEVGFKYSEDLHFMWRVLGLSKIVALLSVPMYYYRWNEGSAMSKFDERRFDGYKLMKKLYPFWKSINVSFGVKFEKYAAARIMWSIMRQASSKMSYNQFKCFFVEYDLYCEMRKLLFFREKKVALTAWVYILSPYCFYQIARNVGKNKVH